MKLHQIPECWKDVILGGMFGFMAWSTFRYIRMQAEWNARRAFIDGARVGAIAQGHLDRERKHNGEETEKEDAPPEQEGAVHQAEGQEAS